MSFFVCSGNHIFTTVNIYTRVCGVCVSDGVVDRLVPTENEVESRFEGPFS